MYNSKPYALAAAPYRAPAYSPQPAPYEDPAPYEPEIYGPEPAPYAPAPYNPPPAPYKEPAPYAAPAPYAPPAPYKAPVAAYPPPPAPYAAPAPYKAPPAYSAPPAYEEPYEEDYWGVPGVPCKDYPCFAEAPYTKFSCAAVPFQPGMYADPETGCQVGSPSIGQHLGSAIEEESDRSEDKGCRCFFGDVLECRTSHLAATMN